MVLERVLAAAGDEDHLLDPRLARLLDGILDERPVDDRQHLLGDRLGGRKETGAEPGHREDGLADAFHARRLSGGRLPPETGPPCPRHGCNVQSTLRLFIA